MRTGIVGCGRIAAFHLPPVLARVGPGSVTVTDLNRDAARRLARTYGLNGSHPDLDAMLAHNRPDVVHILTPPATHAALTIRALKAGCHALVEKPMAMTSREAMSMVDAARQHDRKLCVNHNFRWHPQMGKALALVEQGRAGRVLSADVRFAFDAGRAQPIGTDGRQAGDGWLSGLAGGILFDALSHPASVLLQITGEPVRVSSVMRCNGITGDGAADELSAIVEGVDAMGTLSISLGTRPDCFTATIYATRMTIHVNCSNMTMVVRRHRKIPKAAYRVLDNIGQAVGLFSNTLSGCLGVALGRVGPPGDVAPVINRFYDSIEKGLMPPVPGHQAMHVMRLADEIWQSVPDATVVNIR
ncbi:MAG: Gfo/Idh/MocA family oxidoreductase [Aquisalimonadaceae bacterium]